MLSPPVKNLCGPMIEIARQECADLVIDCYRYLSEDGKSVPEAQRSWKIGQTFSWHYVKNAEHRINQLIRSIEDITMARNRGRSRGGNDFAAYVFVRCELSAEDKKAAKIWIDENTADFGPLLHDVMASDYKFTCSFSQDHDTFTACLVGKEDNALNGKKTLTARHKDWVFAAMTVLYKHLVLFRDGVWISEEASDDDNWG